jgi:hypothetical protein
MTEERYREIYAMLNVVEVLEEDCGKLCGCACCTTENREGTDQEMGIYLLPGEETVHRDDGDWLTMTVDEEGRYFGRCATPPVCPREKRPIQCRTFPLLPHLCEDGSLEMVYNDVELPYRCPLIDEEIPLEDQFVEATQAAWEMLIRDPRIREIVREDSIERERSMMELMDKLF